MFKVVATANFHPKGMQMLRDHPDIDFSVITDPSPEGIKKGVTGADGIVVRTQLLPKEALELASNLRVVSRFGVGTDNIDVAHLSSRGIPLAIAVDANAVAVAEHTLMLMLNLAKDYKAGEASLRGGDWKWRDKGTSGELGGKTVLLMGFGRIGQKVARFCQAFDMRILVFDPYVQSSPIIGVELVADYRRYLPETDYLCMHFPSTPETRALIGREELAAIKRGAFLVNPARGGIIAESLILEALETGQLGGVGLDVFDAEPPAGDNPLFNHPRSYFTPHTAGMSEEAMTRMGVQAAENCIAGLRGELEPRVLFNRKELGL